MISFLNAKRYTFVFNTVHTNVYRTWTVVRAACLFLATTASTCFTAYAGAGLVHGFVRDLLPPPQLTEHPDQPAHPAQLPSTVNVRFKYEILSLFVRVGFF